MVLVVTGLAEEARIARGPEVAAVVCSGGDPRRLRAHLSAFDAHALRAVVSFGIAGGLAPALAAGDVIVATQVMASAPIVEVPRGVSAALAARLRENGIAPMLAPLIGVEEPVLSPSQKALLHAQTGAVAVDMESHIAARFAATKGLPFAAIRVVSDPARRALPQLVNVALRPDGHVDVLAVLKGLMRAPAELRALIRAGADAHKAFAQLRRCRRLLDFRFGFGLAQF